jgi:RNA polymerase sigma factor (sigma-70 family)
MDNNTKELEELLVQQHYGLVVSQALSFCGQTGLLEDYIQVGLIGLLKAIRNYEPARSKFSTFSTTCIKNEILRFKNKNKKHENCTNLIENVSYCEKIQLWEFFPDNLSEEEFFILSLKQSNFTRKEMCEALHCSKRKVDQKINRLIKKLKFYNDE